MLGREGRSTITNRKTFGKLEMPFFYLKFLLSSSLRRVFPTPDVFHGLNIFCDFPLLLSPKRKKKKKITGKVSKREQKWDLAFEVFRRISRLFFFCLNLFLLPPPNLSNPPLFFFKSNMLLVRILYLQPWR